MTPSVQSNIGVSSFIAAFKREGDDINVQECDGIRNSAWSASQFLGKFHALKPLRHHNVCTYIDVVKNRMLIISECYARNLTDFELTSSLRSDSAQMVHLLTDVCRGLAFLNHRDVVHGCLTPETVLFDARSSSYKIAAFGSFLMAGHGSLAPVHFTDVKYLAPEALLLGPHPPPRALHEALTPAADLWSLGVMVCDILQVFNLTEVSVRAWVRLVLEAISTACREPATGFLATMTKGWEKFDSIDSALRSILNLCCTPSLAVRITPCKLLQRLESYPTTQNQVPARLFDPLYDTFPPVTLRCRTWETVTLTESDREILLRSPISGRSVGELYRLWTLAGGDALLEVKAHGYVREEPAILTCPKVATGEFLQFGAGQSPHMDPVKNFVFLDIKPMLEKLEDIPKEIFYPLLTPPNDTADFIGDFLNGVVKLPLRIRESNLKYQLHRQILFHRLLSCYPYTTPDIRKEAAIDIPPLYRARTWAALLGIKGDVQERYDSVDKISPCSSDRQIEVDIPRCHQYNPLMASSEAHAKLKRILKAWITEHPQFVYWQGLDSLCAPFLYLNFSDEPLAYACLSVFIEKYVHKFFLKDNTPVIQGKLDNLLYSIPWFLTMFTHVFPLHKIFHLWDQLLLGDESFPLFVGLSLLTQLKSRLLGYGFNECILLFSDFPDLDIQRCLMIAKEMSAATPKSATYRMHARAVGFANVQECGDTESSREGSYELDLDLLKGEVCPRITWEEIRWFSSTTHDGSKQRRYMPLLIDVRTTDEYLRGTLPHSINIPFLTAFGADGDLLSTYESRMLEERKGKLIVVFDGKCSQAVKFAAELVRLDFPCVCCLHQGIDLLKKSGFVTVPSSL